jgi:hypothetical protein
VDERLRELIVRGMAKDPAARPSSAMEFLAELEALAASAYGADGETAGRARLAAQAAALLSLLSGITAATVAGVGAAAATTWLGTVTSAIAAHAFLYTGIIAAVVGIAGGSLVAVSRATTGHLAGSTLASTVTPAARPPASIATQGAPSAGGRATSTPSAIPSSTSAPSATPSAYGSPVTSGSAGIVSFQGSWYVHDGSLCIGQALQLPTGNTFPPCQGNGNTGWQREWYGCNPIPPTTIPVCNEWDEITFTAGPDGTIIGTVTKVLDTTTDFSVITGPAPATGYLQPATPSRSPM